jgi:hypothetical protein
MDKQHRLATYGSLAPGRPNHHHLDGLDGRWFQGHVRGRLIEAGWGSALGYPALILDPAGSAVEVYIFESIDLPAPGPAWTPSRDPATNEWRPSSIPPPATPKHSSTSSARCCAPRTGRTRSRPDGVLTKTGYVKGG